MFSTRRPLLTLAPLALAGPAVAQTPLTFDIDAAASQFTYGGTTSLGPIVGMPPNFGLSGTVRAELSTTGTGLVDTIQLVMGGDALVSPDLNAEVPNPISILPPLATITITNLRFDLRSDAGNVAPATGTFQVNVTSTVLSGTATITPLVGSVSTVDLTGTTSTPQPYGGILLVNSASSRIQGPLQINFQLTDPGTGITADLNVMGTVAADFVHPSPTTYCMSTPNSTGNMAAIGTNGATSLLAANLELQAQMLPQNSLGFFLFSEDQAFAPGLGGGPGNLCLGGQIFRLSNFVLNSGTTGQVALTLPVGSGLGYPLNIGDTLNFQYWFRDTSPTGSTSNTSDGVAVQFVP